ncbi:hypothetical protein BD410DRAFT_833972 [Rickenella mellea]|uniref:ferric-chelate reductase (NADPH) n=1 Tax=Rickenella mellea TaxID=50990 RepID=A0A4R5XEY1_9AGAM|nr:hypothetical protein BD410DRAFT_833972 [Rickenella mellea]
MQAKYVKEFWLFLTGVIALLTIVNFTTRLVAFLTKLGQPLDRQNSSEAVPPGRTGKLSIRRIPAAFTSVFKVVAFRTTIPIGLSSVSSVSELVFITGYMTALLVWLFVDTRDLTKFFYEDRAAHLASCQLPLIVALAGKNNIISFLVGIGHEKLNVLHRAAARACLLLLWIHAMVRYKSGLPASFNLTHDWMRWGVVGLAAFTLAAILSIRPIRHAAFEFFLVTHIILIAIFLVGGYMHAKAPGFGDYIWPALLVWGLDRFLRFTYLLWNNRVWRGNAESAATVELITSDTVRLTLHRRFSWKAGQHAYVVLPSVSNLPTEAHPFTIASIPYRLDGREQSKKEVVFLIRGRSGFTQRLREHATAKIAGSVPALIDGPYGYPPNLKVFHTCVLIVGGSGVSYTLPLLLDLIHNGRSNKSAVRRILFVWCIRDPEHLSWIAKSLSSALTNAPSTLHIDARIHITQSNGKLPSLKALDYDDMKESSEDIKTPSSPSGSAEYDDIKAPLPSPSISVENNIDSGFKSFTTVLGRPDIDQLLKDAVLTADGPVSVDVAGPSSLAESIRGVLSSDIVSPIGVLKGVPSVTLHVETFGMVKG